MRIPRTPFEERPGGWLASAPSHSNIERAVVQAQTTRLGPADRVQVAPERSRPNTGKHDGGHEPARVATTDEARAVSLCTARAGGQFGKANPNDRDPRAILARGELAAGALAGDQESRPSYTGGRGKM